MMNPLSQYLMIGKLVALLGAIALICYQGSQIHKWHQHSLQLSELRAADRRAYEAAQVQAQAKNDATLTRVKSEQEAITNEVKSDLQSRLELIRRELRNPGAPQGSPRGPATGVAGEAPCRALIRPGCVLRPKSVCPQPKRRAARPANHLG
jgi:hypothetical protein